MEFRRVQPGDFEGLIELQNANLATNLSDDQKRDGFLSVGFSAEQFAAMNDDVAVIVGVEGDEVKAFLCASSIESNMQFALPKAMIDRFPGVVHDSKPLSDWRVCIAGPMCVDAQFRGQGVVKMLYDCLAEVASPRYDLAVVFVSVANPRSIKAASDKLHMQVIDEFDFDARHYVTMAGRLG